MPQKALPPLGEKVHFCRIKPAGDGKPAELIKGEGIVVGHIIGITRRLQVMVKDGDTSANKAWTLEPFCINPTDDEAQAYLAHHGQLQSVVDDFNSRAQRAISDGNAAVEEHNAVMFGPPLEI